jgi:hypothetical protein
MSCFIQASEKSAAIVFVLQSILMGPPPEIRRGGTRIFRF